MSRLRVKLESVDWERMGLRTQQAIDRAMDAGQKRQRDREMGQGSLFGDGAASTGAGSAPACASATSAERAVCGADAACSAASAARPSEGMGMRIVVCAKEVLDPDAVSPALEVSARSPDGEIMAVRHRELPVVGVQFHPESVLAESGHELLAAFLRLESRP